ncbi:MAG TPA: 30S ribosomal protein S20 [Thermoanaerobaculia bacterium]|nr:30S ribosomal protein S20 [Thermoanaerobaculia bacterium]
MANIRSAEKQRRQAEKANQRNRAGMSRLRTQLKKTRKAIADGGDDVKEILSETASLIDKAAKRKVIKTNTADRYKSRLSAAAKRSAAAK